MGFVSNSSSTSYNVCIPSDEDVSKWESSVKYYIDKEKKSEYGSYDLSLEKTMELLKSLKNGWSTPYEGNDDEREAFYLFVDMFHGSKSEFLLGSEHTDVAYNGEWHNLCSGNNGDKMKDILCKR